MARRESRRQTNTRRVNARSREEFAPPTRVSARCARFSRRHGVARRPQKFSLARRLWMPTCLRKKVKKVENCKNLMWLERSQKKKCRRICGRKQRKKEINYRYQCCRHMEPCGRIKTPLPRYQVHFYCARAFAFLFSFVAGREKTRSMGRRVKKGPKMLALYAMKCVSFWCRSYYALSFFYTKEDFDFYQGISSPL